MAYDAAYILMQTDKQRLDVEKTKTGHWLNGEKLSALINVFPKG